MGLVNTFNDGIVFVYCFGIRCITINKNIKMNTEFLVHHVTGYIPLVRYLPRNGNISRNLLGILLAISSARIIERISSIMYVCMYVCMCARTHARTHGRTYRRMHALMYVCMFVRMCVCTYVCMHACMYVRTYVRMYLCSPPICRIFDGRDYFGYFGKS